MTDVVNSFVAGYMNKDLDERLIPEGVYRNALNIDVDTDQGSNVGAARNSLGNTIVANIDTASGETSVNAKTIGVVKYEANNLIYWLVASDDFDAIFEYNEITGAVIRVLQCSNPGGGSTLNFNQRYIVTGINYINGFLYWTDDYNPPRRINIARAKSYSVDDARIADDISVIMAPPLNPPMIRLYDDGTEANNLSEKFISISYRYKYIDGQYSAMSPFSGVLFTPSEYEIDYQAGNNKSMLNNYNSAWIKFNTGGLNVTDIQVLMRDTRSMNISVIETFNKVKIDVEDNDHYEFSFNNNKTYTVLTSDQITRTFDNVPLLAKSQDFVGNRLMYGNYTQFYNLTDCDGDKVNTNLELSYISEAVANGTTIQTFRSDRDYEVAIEYTDEFARHTTALTYNENTVYIPATQSDKGNSLVVKVKNKPPCWATGYRILVKQSKKEYYNIFPILYCFVGSGLDRYFLINESDRDKFAVGGYVIFKSDKSGPTYSNKQYKILGLQFRDGASMISGVSGLYFQIKVDSPTELDNTGEFYYWSEGKGFGYVEPTYFSPQSDKRPARSVINRFKVVENPIFYGEGNENALTNTSNVYSPSILTLDDKRISIVILTATTFGIYDTNLSDGSSNPSLVYSGAIVPNTAISYLASIGIYGVYFNQSSGYVIGDKWVINVRSKDIKFGLDEVLYGDTDSSSSTNIAVAIVPGGSNWTSTTPETDRAIEVGAIIKLQVLEDKPNGTNVYTNLQTFQASQRRYENIEEWWYESNARSSFIFNDIYGNNIKSQRVRFRRGTTFNPNAGGYNSENSNQINQGSSITATTMKYPVHMLIPSSVYVNRRENNDLYSGDDQGVIRVAFEITQSDTPTICETVGRDNDLDIYHEASRTYAIKNNLHEVTWKYQDFTAPAYALGNTNLGQLVPGSAITADDQEHWFSVGEQIYVKYNNSTASPSGMYTITVIPDAYNIVIDKPFVAGATVAGYCSYSSTDRNQSNYISAPAIIKINNPNSVNSVFNGWSFGNGLESDRIRDDFNATELDYSPRVNTVIDDYKQRLSYNAICYSGAYGENTGLNRLNEFNLSVANFKYLDSEFGSIQKLYARDTDLMVFQENKISKVLYGKNLLYDAVGGGQVSSISEVLGTQVAYPGEWGISKNPESFAEWGGDVYWTDARRGAVLLMGSWETKGNQIVPISSNGMTDHFRDLMKDSPNTQKLGCYDPNNKKYVLASNDISINKCNLTLSRDAAKIGYGPLSQQINAFTIITDSSWTITLTAVGAFGTGWVTNVPVSGYGTQDIYPIIAANNTSIVRSVIFTITYCTNLTQTFTLTQAIGRKGKLIVMVSNNILRR